MLLRSLILILLVPSVALAAAAPSPTSVVPDRPLSLEDCTGIALQMNPQITSTDQSVIGARAGLTRARSSYYPQVSASAVEGIASVTPGNSERQQQADLALRQTLWRRGLKESVDQSRASLWAAEYERAAVIQGLVEQVASDYYGVLATEQLVGVSEAGVASAQQHLDQVRARVSFGDAAEVDVYPAQDDLARAQLDLIDARSNVRLALARLKNTMGISPETYLKLAPAGEPGEAPSSSLAEALQTALSRRPDALAAQASVAASRSALKQAIIRRGPVADISGEYGQSYSEREARDPSWNVLLSIALPLLDGQATKADVIGSRASLGRAEAESQRTTNQIGLEVESALVEVERARERVGASAVSVAAAEARLAAAEGKYTQGIGILIEVIDARVAVTNAQANQVRARYDYQTALVGLQKATGILRVPGSE